MAKRDTWVQVSRTIWCSLVVPDGTFSRHYYRQVEQRERTDLPERKERWRNLNWVNHKDMHCDSSSVWLLASWLRFLNSWFDSYFAPGDFLLFPRWNQSSEDVVDRMSLKFRDSRRPSYTIFHNRRVQRNLQHWKKSWPLHNPSGGSNNISLWALSGDVCMKH